MQMRSSSLAILPFLVTLIIGLSACGKNDNYPSANLNADDLSEKPAEIGTTEFKCTASLKQNWLDEKAKSLSLTTKEVVTKLEEEKPLILGDTSFANEKENIADSPNLVNLRLALFFPAEPSMNCEKGLHELQFGSTSVNRFMNRNVTASTNFCWDPRGKTVNVFQNVLFGGERKNIGAQMQQQDDLKTAGFTDVEGTPVKYQITCNR